MERRTCEMVILAILQKMFSNNLLKGDKKKKKTLNRVKTNTLCTKESHALGRSILNDIGAFLHQIEHGLFLVACQN